MVGKGSETSRIPHMDSLGPLEEIEGLVSPVRTFLWIIGLSDSTSSLKERLASQRVRDWQDFLAASLSH